MLPQNNRCLRETGFLTRAQAQRTPVSIACRSRTKPAWSRKTMNVFEKPGFCLVSIAQNGSPTSKIIDGLCAGCGGILADERKRHPRGLLRTVARVEPARQHVAL